MPPGQGWSARWAHAGLGLVLGLAPGCALSRTQIDRAVQADRGTPTRNHGVAEAYGVSCPDVLEIAITGHPEVQGRQEVQPDGRIDLGSLGRVRVEGLGLDDISRRIGSLAGVPAQSVRVRVAEFRSQQIYVFGQVAGLERAVAYQGPETVLDFLQRVGGVTPGAASEDVAVVRSRIAEGESPQVFRIDLAAIASGKDKTTNIRLQPFDEVYVGQSRSSVVAGCVAPCLKPIFTVFSGLYRSENVVPPAVTPPTNVPPTASWRPPSGR